MHDPPVRRIVHFCKAITDKATTCVCGEDAMRSLAATCTVQKSGATGKPLELVINNDNRGGIAYCHPILKNPDRYLRFNRRRST